MRERKSGKRMSKRERGRERESGKKRFKEREREIVEER